MAGSLKNPEFGPNSGRYIISICRKPLMINRPLWRILYASAWPQDGSRFESSLGCFLFSLLFFLLIFTFSVLFGPLSPSPFPQKISICNLCASESPEVCNITFHSGYHLQELRG